MTNRIMLRAIPKNWFSWNFTILEGSQHLADIEVAWWHEKGAVIVENEVYHVYREGLASGAFILESSVGELARAEKPSLFRRCFLIEHEDRQYTLRAVAALSREYTLTDESGEIGRLAPEGWLTHRARVDLPDYIPLPIRLFIIWLTILLWKRQAQS